MKPKYFEPKTHVDDFIDAHDTDKYASWVLSLFRLPAILSHKFKDFIKEYKLYCTYEGKRYRVVGASRMGDIWLHSDMNHGESTQPYYEHRVMIDDVIDLNKYKSYTKGFNMVNMEKLRKHYGERDVHMYCVECNSKFSANPGDYFATPDDHVFKHCGEPVSLIRETVEHEVL